MRPVAAAQGIFYVVTGLWPVLHLRSFEAVTGEKTDKWLVRTTGGLIAAIGLALLTSGRAHRTAKVLGVASAAVLAAADILAVGKRRIPRIYLADAACEVGAIGAWIAEGQLRTLW